MRNLTAKAVLAPTVIAMVACFYGTLLWTVYMSFTRSGLVPNYGWNGLAQYYRLFNTVRWNTAYGNMFLFGGLTIVGALAVGTGLAILIDSRVRFEGTLRTIMLYPLSISFIITGLAWQWILSPTIGIQSWVQSLGWTDFQFDWIVRQDRAIYTLVFAAIWHQGGLIMAMMLAGLRGVDAEIWKATQLEGISRARVYWSIVLPMLRPLIVTCVVLLTVAVVKSYDLVVAMTGGGPGFASDLPGKFVVDAIFDRANLGLASAGAVIMLTSILAALAPYLYIEISRRHA